MNSFVNSSIMVNDNYQFNIEKYKKLLLGKERPFTFGYSRLSRDDDKEQNSLNNQNRIIKTFSDTMELDIIDIIIDDGITGMTFDRDGLTILKDLIDGGLVDIIIVKDLSRLGRHKAYSALFIEYLTKKGIKVLSAIEGIDTSNENDDLVIGFKQIINEQYSKDLSRKIRSGFKQKQKDRGVVIIPPFGYMKVKGTKDIVIVEETANIVRYIYKMYIEEGIGASKIADRLTKEGYKTPSQYQKELLGKSVPINKTSKTHMWYDNTISQILRNDAYIGTLRNNKNYKSTIYNVRKHLPEEEHILHENYYLPIIDNKTWELAQAIRSNRTTNNVRASSNAKVHRYAGILKCGDCGATFTAKKRSNKEDGKYVEYVCNNYHRRGKDACSSHRIKETDINDIVYSYLDRIKILAEENLLKVDEFITEWNNRKREYDKEIDRYKVEVNQLKEDVKQYAQQLARNLINEELFKELTRENYGKINLVEKQIETLEEMVEINKDSRKGIRSSVELLTEIVNNKELSDAHLQMLISSINITEDSNNQLNLDISLNTPFKYHASLSGYFTDPMHS